MKNTGMIRHIDELGRIVIPKEIREVLRINNGDELEIYLENNNIILHQYSSLIQEKKKHDKMFDALNSLVDGLLLLGDNEKIITQGIYEDQAYDLEIRKKMQERKAYASLVMDTFQIGNELLKGYFYLQPLIRDSIIKGVIILCKKSKINHEDEVFMRVLQNIIDNY